jgi:hypothetical protein
MGTSITDETTKDIGLLDRRLEYERIIDEKNK